VTFDPVVNCFMRLTFPTANRKHFFMNILCIEPSCPQKTHNWIPLFGSTFLRHIRQFDYRNQSLKLRVCYLGCHEAGLCCYLMINIEYLLCPLQLFYFHLWPIYWLFLIEWIEWGYQEGH
jgi:hypothetical protein